MNDGMISEGDARAMIRLVADVVGMNADHATAKSRLMDGLLEMVGANAWVWTLAYLHPEKSPVYVAIHHGGFSEERYVRLIKASSHPDMTMLMAPFAQEMRTRACHITRLRQQIDRNNTFPSTDVFPLWRAADIGPLMLSARPVNDECVSLIGIYRLADEPLFGERERQIAHILLAEVPWLHEMGWPDDLGAAAPKLSVRSRQVLTFLLEGMPRKAIADQLEISVHTVADYIKEVYRVFGVGSQAELMRRFKIGENEDA